MMMMMMVMVVIVITIVVIAIMILIRVVIESIDNDDDNTACSNSRQSTISNGPSSGGIPVIDTRERTASKGTGT